jgi:diguanylate cyclase (GGDEF)-like protein
MKRERSYWLFRVLIIFIGAVVVVLSASHLPLTRLDVRFLILVVMTIGISAGVAVEIPGTRAQITVSDTFIFLTLLLYGGETATLLAALEGISSSFRISKRWSTLLFNSAVMACATFSTSWGLRIFFGPILDSSRSKYSAIFVTAICFMALVQYAINSSLIAIDKALRAMQPIWHTWTKDYLWTSITYFAGASAAGIIAKLITEVSFFAVMATVPIIAIVYFTYRTYLKSVEVSTAQARQAECHVEELNRHIAEQERTSKELEQSREHFRNAALHDALTGLPNRALLTNHLKLAIDHGLREPNHLFAVFFLDLDRFKNINDSLGHLAGDQLLVAVANRLGDCVRPTDTVARLGGDEFAILLNGLLDYKDALRVAERVQTAMSLPVYLDGHECFTTVSIGIALSATGYEDPENILRDADTAMYRAKENGKARFELFDSTMHARAVALLQLENDLRRAVEREEFRLHYQPIVSLESGEINGFEALVRWQHPKRGLVAPLEFIPLAEDTGLIVDIGQWVLREACCQMAEWQKQSPANRSLILSVNLSSRQFAQTSLIQQISGILQQSGLDPRCLRLEITESVLMESADSACTTLSQLRSLGISVSIDDFGTGYSSLSYLHRFPVNTLKIDRSFISRMGVGGGNSEVIRTIISLASTLGLDVVAEGVETEDQRERLKALDCEFCQGYLFSRPVDAEAATAMLQKRSKKQPLVSAAKASLTTRPESFAEPTLYCELQAS